ncbi:cell division ATPase MinD [Candidatus Woesearchaeota archaeon]|nr:cell division ATPase MinD [Candidatus Woesearchaeota archaeon]
MTKFVAVVSAKGGVGKTSTTINVSSALEWFRRDVIAMDANFANPDIGIHLGAELMDKTIHSALRGMHHIRESIYLHPSGIKIIPGSISYDEARKVKRDNLGNIILDLVGSAEIVIVDSTPGLGEDATSVIKAVDYVLIVTTPDLCSVSNSIKMVNLAREFGKMILGIVVNRVEGHEYELDLDNIEMLLGNRVVAVIPEDKNIKDSFHKKNPVVFIHPKSPSSDAFKRLASELIGERYVKLAKKEEDSFYTLAKRAVGLGR